LEDEFQHNGILGTLGWVWDSITHWKAPKVKHPKPLDVALNNYHTYSGQKDFTGRPERRQNRRQNKRPKQKRPERQQQQQQPQQQPQPQQQQRRKLRPFEATDSYHTYYTNSFDY